MSQQTVTHEPTAAETPDQPAVVFTSDSYAFYRQENGAYSDGINSFSSLALLKAGANTVETDLSLFMRDDGTLSLPEMIVMQGRICGSQRIETDLLPVNPTTGKPIHGIGHWRVTAEGKVERWRASTDGEVLREEFIVAALYEILPEEEERLREMLITYPFEMYEVKDCAGYWHVEVGGRRVALVIYREGRKCSYSVTEDARPVKGAVCPACGKELNMAGDARAAARQTDVQLKHLNHCPACFHLLTDEEMTSIRRKERLSKATVPQD